MLIQNKSGQSVSKRSAPTLDDIYEAIKHGKLRAEKDIISALKVCLKPDCGLQQFNFGVLSVDAIAQASNTAAEFVQAGAYKEPYDLCMYRASITYNDEPEPIGQSYIMMTRADNEPGVACVHLCHSEDHLIAVHCINTMDVRMAPAGFHRGAGLGVIVKVLDKEIDYWRSMLSEDQRYTVTPEHLGEAAVTVMGLTMILNTKGIRKETTAPPRKPNEARARAGRPLLPYVTHVHTNVYMRAVQDGPKGTHASPRPHMRRAHVRTYLNEDGSVNHRTPIDAMLVNWDGSPLARGQYEVSE